MGSFGSKGGLRHVTPFNNKHSTSSCASSDSEPCLEQEEPFIDLRQLAGTLELKNEVNVPEEQDN